ncbi:phage tail assembly chaperone [Alicyclobacillus acidoterrestris]|uniref:phage tail assembly chaperone n=1 Tax=Alicyclobacillus acidoterrestris TaxID=1450 RepID=UPI003F53ACAB
MAEKYKDVTIKGQEYRIGKFSAREGAFIIPKVAGILAPIFAPLLKGLDLKQVDKPEDINLKGIDIASILGPLANLKEDDFMYLQDKCLKVCQAKKPVGLIPVLNDNGSFSVAELEDDGMAVLTLMVHTLIHNLAGFFSGSPLAGLLSGIPVINSQS